MLLGKCLTNSSVLHLKKEKRNQKKENNLLLFWTKLLHSLQPNSYLWMVSTSKILFLTV